MVDVARLAGVSHQTVSRVVNGSARVAEPTRERVLHAMRMLDYQPSSVARALVTGRSRTVGMVSFDTTLYGPASTLFGIERAAHEADYFTSIVSLPALDRGAVVAAVERLRRQGVEGILAVTPQRTAFGALAALSREVPLVAVEGGPEGGVPVVAIDQFAGATAATRHLLELGHETVFHIAGPPDWQEAELRLQGWRATLLEEGATVPTPLSGDWTPASGYDLGRLVAEMPRVTALFVANDQMALGALRALDRAGRRVPEDVSVVGFDDIPEAAYMTPPLTTVQQPFREVGRSSIQALLAAIEGTGGSGVCTVIPPHLVVRQSADAPSARR
jgi:DNA-binding LacI/PurR family transcriptional regulator